MIKIIFADMDKTIVRNDENGVYRISDEDVEAINKMKEDGIHFIITTGRFGLSIKHDMKKYGIWCDRITSSGSAITIDDTVHLLGEVDPFIFERCFERINERFPVFYSNFVIREDENYRYNTLEQADYSNDAYLEQMRKHRSGINKFQFRFGNAEEMAEVRAMLEEYSEIIEGNYNSIYAADYTATGVNKGAAIRFVCDYFGISYGETAGIGDGENDISIMDNTAFNFAMKESHPALYPHCQYTVSSIREMYDIIKEINDN